MENSLPSGINEKELVKAFEEFKQIDCPEPPGNDDLYDLYSELMEYDGYVVGLVSTFLKNKQVKKGHIFQNKKLVNSLSNFPVDSEELRSLKRYLDKLDKMVQMLIILV